MSRDDWLWDGSGKPDPEAERIARALGDLAYEGELPDLPEQHTPRPWGLGAGIGAFLLLAAALLLAMRSGPAVEEVAPPEPETIVASATAWGVEPVEGMPLCNDKPVIEDVVLDQGNWLATGEQDAARVTVADLGFLEVAPDSALRLVSSTNEEHRLELARGKVDVAVAAPPRMLVIDTPGGEIVDLGCAYTLEVADNGYGRVEVTDGKVAIEHPAHHVLVPEGAWAKTRGPLGPSVPAFLDADPRIAALAMAAADEPGDDTALEELLAKATPRDTLTMVHLIERVGVPQRQALYRRIAELAGGVSVSENVVVALDGDALTTLLADASTAW